MEFADYIASPKINGVVLHSPFNEPVDGTLCITGHHLILSSRQEGSQELWLLHESIDYLEKKVNIINGNVPQGGTIIIKCKDLRIIQLEISTTEEFQNAYTSLEKLSNISDLFNLYPFFYRPMYNILEDGYTLFRPEVEFAKLISGDDWRLSNVNKDYSVCPTYGPVLVVPKLLDDEIIIASASFREGGRFPLLSYKHESGAVLLRSSQPLLANSNKRSRADEKLLNYVLGANKKGYIIDTRSLSMANQCKAKGGGYEPDGHYTQWKRLHKSLDKVSICNGALLESFSKLMDACNDMNCSPDKLLSKIDNSQWLTHVHNALNASCLVAQCLDQEGASVLVHGSSGLDSTLLVTSLTQVILNPDCRTLRGAVPILRGSIFRVWSLFCLQLPQIIVTHLLNNDYPWLLEAEKHVEAVTENRYRQCLSFSRIQALIDREWVQAGHPFSKRHNSSCYSTSQTGRSKSSQPTFLLFLDCVHQLHNQFPCSFEFTTNLLIQLFEHSYFSQFGTFIGNCEAERENIDLYKKTTSLWSYLNRPDILTALLNPMYEPNRTAIWPSVAPVSLVLWSELYLRWIIDQTNQKKALNKIQSLIQHDKNLRSKVIRLRKQLQDLHREWANLNQTENESVL